jgi:hypothetical protein
MNSIKLSVFDRRIGFGIAAAVLVLATFMSALVSADQVTQRSIELSSSSVSATNVTYTVKFTAVHAAGAFVVDFCSDSPVLGQTCTAPTGFNATAAASTTSGFTDVTGATSKVTVAGTINASDNVSVAVTGVTNPSTAGPLYARIVTYDTKAHALLYTSTGAGTDTNVQDNGGVAISITPTIGVSGSVLESMTFCVSGAAITDNCVTTTPPTLKLGETVGSSLALDAAHVSTGNIYTQISTNASSGAVVNLKSSATNCGGLINSSKPSGCYILPALTGGITAGQAKFGVKTATATNLNGSSNGTLQPVTGSGYSNSAYALNYVAGNATGVTSTYGDPFLDTNSVPANGQNMQLTFGASVSNSTPAGSYSTDLSLIATGKY